MFHRTLVATLFAVAASSAALGALGGCLAGEPKTALSYTQDAKKSYEDALAEYNAHNWIEAQNMFRELKRKYGYSRYARLAELKIADCDLELDKFAEAVKAYRQFVHDHPADEEDISYARSRIVDSQYRQLADSLVLASGEERDQAVVLDSHKEMQSFLRDYPKSKEAPRIQKLLADIVGRLIKHELYVARFYLNRGNYDAAVLRIEYAMRNYGPRKALDPMLDPSDSAIGPGAAPRKAKTAYDRPQVSSGLEPEALLLLGETYLKMKKPENAKDTFRSLIDAYPDSALVIQAKNYLSRIP